MKKITLFLSLAICVIHINAMKRPCTCIDRRKTLYRKITESQNSEHPFDFPSLPQDMQNIVLNFVTNNTTESKPKNATETVNALAQTNKALNKIINEQNFSDKLIKNFANRFFCSQETIAKYLQTAQSKERLFLQYDLKNLCTHPKNKKILSRSLNQLIAKGVDLEFTYNHEHIHKTALMICAKNNRNMFSLLLEKGVDINNGNVYGITTLHLASSYPVDSSLVDVLISYRNLDINRQTKNGKTALLLCLIDRLKRSVVVGFINTIVVLLKAGVDPELADNRGCTPLAVAQKLGNQRIVLLIQNAITEKHSKQLTNTQ